MNEELKVLLAGMNSISGQMDEILSSQTAQARLLTEQADVLSGLDDRITLIEKVEPAHRTVGAGDLPGLEDEKEEFSFVRALRGIAYGQWGRGYEKRVFQEGARVRYGMGGNEVGNMAEDRAGSADDDSAGGYWVPPQVLSDFIEELTPNLVTIAAGATVMTDLVGSPVEVPKDNGGVTAYWVAENANITASDASAGQLRLEPHELAALVKLSQRLLRLSTPAAEGIVRRILNRRIAEALDIAALRGSGADGQPLGIANQTGILEVEIATDGGALTLDIVDKMRQELSVNNALRGKLAYVTHPAVAGKLRRQKVVEYSGGTEGAPIFMIASSDSEISSRTGFAWHETTQLPTNLTKGSGTSLSEVYFGNWEELLIGVWGGLELLASNVAGDGSSGAFVSNQVWIRAIIEVDTAVRHPESFCLVNDATTT